MVWSKIADTIYVLAALAVCLIAGVMGVFYFYLYGGTAGPSIDDFVQRVLDTVLRLIF